MRQIEPYHRGKVPYRYLITSRIELAKKREEESYVPHRCA